MSKTKPETGTHNRTLTCANCSVELYSGSGPPDLTESHGQRVNVTSILVEAVQGADGQTCDKQNETENVPVPNALNFILHLPCQNALTCYISLCEECAGVVTHIYRFYKLLESKAKPGSKLNSVFKEISGRVHQSLSIYPLDENGMGKENFRLPANVDNTSEFGHSPEQIEEENEDSFWENMNMNYIQGPEPWSPPSPDPLDEVFASLPKLKRAKGMPRKEKDIKVKGMPRKEKDIKVKGLPHKDPKAKVKRVRCRPRKDLKDRKPPKEKKPKLSQGKMLYVI